MGYRAIKRGKKALKKNADGVQKQIPLSSCHLTWGLERKTCKACPILPGLTQPTDTGWTMHSPGQPPTPQPLTPQELSSAGRDAMAQLPPKQNPNLDRCAPKGA